MPISNFPTELQNIIQQKYLDKEFQDSLESITGYDNIADVEQFDTQIGETLTKTRAGLLAPVTTPLDPSANTGLDNGLTASTYSVEQYTLKLNQYAATVNHDVLTTKVGIGKQFLHKIRALGIQAKQSRDRLARNTLFNTHLGMNTRVRTTLGAPAATLAVDDIRGFGEAPINGTMAPVSVSNPMTVFVNDVSHTLVGVTADDTNVSTAPGGISGTLTFSANVSVANGTAGKPVVAEHAPLILRPNGRKTTADLVATDKVTLSLILDGVAQHRDNNVPPAEGGMYNFYCDNKTAREVFADPDFKLLYTGQAASAAFRSGKVVEMLDVRFVPTTEALQQNLNGIPIRRAILCGQGALIRGDFAGLTSRDIGDDGDTNTVVVDGIAQIVREPLDRLKQFIALSWTVITSYACPTDITADNTIIPTASKSYNKRAIVFETA